MTKKEIINGLEIYTVGRLKKSRVDITVEELQQFIDAIKSLEQESKRGHWELVQRGKCIDVCCSNCKAVRIKDYAYNYTIDQLSKEDLKECFECADMRYCPNCGAKMINEVEL